MTARPGRLVAAVQRSLVAMSVPRASDGVVVALSGGPDSIALTDALSGLSRKMGFRVIAAHLDHQIRPESAEDARFCSELCARLGVPLRHGTADVAARARRDRSGLEDAAREERYAFLRETMRREGCVAIAVAHTRDDQAETVLLRLLRGAGSLGLGAMRAQSGDVIRPLLEVSRAEVLVYLAERGLAWREDASNADPHFLRNRVRHELLPLLETRFNPNVRATLARSAALLADEAALLATHAERLLDEVARYDGDALSLDRAVLAAAPRAVARLALRKALERVGGLRNVNTVQVERVLELAAAEHSSGRRLPLPGGREAVVAFSEMRVGPKRAAPKAFARRLSVPGTVDVPGGMRIVAGPAEGPAVSSVDAAVIAAPARGLVVRTRRPGDRVRAKGRLLSLKRYLIERRVPADVRGGLAVVASGRDVLWVPGQPADCTQGRRFVRLQLERP
jgi:tRNA(Ile)-lysidine synthase